jgi:transcription elongation factor GreA
MKGAPVVDNLLITARGHEQLRSELERLRSEGRRAMSERLREARADGHPDDNPGLFDAFEEQAQLERRIALLEQRLATARLAEPSSDGSAGIGSSVLLRDLETGELVEFELVGALESDAARGRVSVDAPVGRALVGVAASETVNVAGPRRELRFEVLRVETAPRGPIVSIAA